MFFSSAFVPEKPLETKRLLIRPLQRRDAPDIYDYSKDKEVARYVLWHHQEDISEARAVISHQRRLYRRGEPCSLGIVLKETGTVIGTIGFMSFSDEHDTAEIGYSMGRKYWNKGLMTEAVGAMIAFGFDRLGLNRIEAMHEPENPASGRVMEKNGMRREGILRQKLCNKGKYVDTVMYAILRQDYEQREDD